MGKGTNMTTLQFDIYILKFTRCEDPDFPYDNPEDDQC